MGRGMMLDADVAADVADAEAAITRLNLEASALVDTEALARLLLRSESVASSHIEGLQIGGRRLLRAESALSMGVPADDVTAEEVLGNIEAMRWAVDSLSAAPVLTIDGLLEVHRRLLARTPGAKEFAGRLRHRQNWIGGSAYTPCRASFVPPPPDHVAPLVQDLLTFCNLDTLPAVAQAAVAHAQFETIHPFADGNGRVGRALSHVVLRRRGVAPRVLPPLSMALARSSASYVEGLTATRYRGRADSRAAHDGINSWVAQFAAACRQAVDDARAFEARIADIQKQWREALGKVRADSSVDLLVRRLPGAPVVTAAGAAELIGRSFQAANGAVERLLEAGVLKQVNVGKRNRAFEAKAVIDAFADLERELSSPAAGPG
ncbi:MAG TPA: Fic family protein [Acidimicrobiales bacterium]|nr:Fic family protein [Acidimicrobiales bacterium]